jgi:hypothetical protein
VSAGHSSRIGLFGNLSGLSWMEVDNNLSQTGPKEPQHAPDLTKPELSTICSLLHAPPSTSMPSSPPPSPSPPAVRRRGAIYGVFGSCFWVNQAHGVQASGVWLPASPLEPGSPDTISLLLSASPETAVSAEPSSAHAAVSLTNDVLVYN